LVGVAFVNKHVVKTACKGQGKAVMDVYFVIRITLKALLYYRGVLISKLTDIPIADILAIKRTDSDKDMATSMDDLIVMS